MNYWESTKQELKNTGIYILLCLVFIFLLCFPQTARTGAYAGLTLWANTVIPVLFPFLLASNLFAALGMASGKWYAVLLGFLCGYPMGAKAACDLVKEGSVTKKQGQWLMCCCNLPSPMFLTGFIRIPAVTWAVYLPAVLLLIPVFFFSKQTNVKSFSNIQPVNQVTHQSEKQLSNWPKRQIKGRFNNQPELRFEAPPKVMPLLEQAMEASVKIMIKIGIYMMIFSILSVWIQNFHFLSPFMRTLLPGLSEMTIGINAAKNAGFPIRQQAILCAIFCTFGGCSGLSQTKSVTDEAAFSMKFYIIVRLLHVAAAAMIIFCWRF